MQGGRIYLIQNSSAVPLSISRKRLRNTNLKWKKEQKVDRPEGESSLFC